MTRDRSRRRAVVVVVVLLVVSTVGPVALATSASASQGALDSSSDASQIVLDVDENATAENDSDEQATDGNVTDADADADDDDVTTIVRDVDEFVRVTEYRYDEDREIFFVTLENQGDARSTVTLTEAIEADDSGASTFGISRVRIGGESTATVEVDVRRNSNGAAGVMITTDRSIAQGQGTVLWDVDEPTSSLFDAAPSYGTVWLGALVALFVVGILTIGAAWQYVATVHDDVEDVDVSGGTA